MRVRKATIAGVGVNPSALAILDLDRGTEVPYEVELSLGDLRPDFFRLYADWLADMREFPDPDDEIEERLRALRWPSLGVLVEVEPALFAIVMLVLGKEVLADLEHGRDALVQVQYVPRPADEVELRGRRIVMRGHAIALPVRSSGAGVMAGRAAGSA
jgi:hypothetical protein